ncbi:MAG: polymorphic toxin-type HINT domain-containing protein [Planctomycetota bacterium]
MFSLRPLSRVLLLFSSLVILLVEPIAAFAVADPSDDFAAKLKNPSAAESIMKAMDAEAMGDLELREKTLEANQDYPAAKWYSGQMLEGPKWSSIEEAISNAQKAPKLTAYEEARKGIVDNFDGHLRMAQWCASQKLENQWRSHMERALLFQPDNGGVRAALGYVRMGGDWMGPNEIANLRAQTEYARQGYEDFGKAFQQIRSDMLSRDPQVRRQAELRIGEYDEPGVVPCLEALMTGDANRFTEQALATLRRIDTIESSKALAKVGLFCPEPDLRRLAADYLKERPLYDFVPDVLQILETPTSFMLMPIFAPDRSVVGYQYAYAKERMDAKEFVLVGQPQPVNARENAMRRMANARNANLNEFLQQWANAATNGRNNSVRFSNVRGGIARGDAGDVFEGFQKTFGNIFGANEDGKVLQTDDNELLDLRNTRVAELLNRVADTRRGSTPQELWKWWDDHNETGYQQSKSERIRGAISFRQKYARDALREQQRVYEEALADSVRGRHECFVAGTTVVTRRGHKVIEDIAIGDEVLSRNIATGELTWKAVLQPTERPAGATVIIRTDNDQFQCTPGHLFWVSGKGWQRAGELASGDVLHAAEQPAVVKSTENGQPQVTYNLVVADNSNYFVGDAMVLTHDVTPRNHSRQTVPGDEMLRQYAK